MKCLLALAALLILAGCAKDPEDRAFFNTGWVHPDKAADARLNGTAR